MRDRYVGDIGDFAKYGLLRALGRGKRLGVAWYRRTDPDPTNANDGRFTNYLEDPKKWRCLDPKLFDGLKELIREDRRTIAEVQQSGLLNKATFFDDPLDLSQVPKNDRKRRRQKWFGRVKKRLADCDLVFADPDNGLYPNDSFKYTRIENSKRIPLFEALALADDRSAVFYHHNTRFEGGHDLEIQSWMDQLPAGTLAYYWRRYSPRTFFVVNPDAIMVRRLEKFAERWGENGKLVRDRPRLRADGPRDRVIKNKCEEMAKFETGEPVDNLAESDIDLLLLEEFAVSGDFVAWFCSRAGVQSARLEKARRNVADSDGESDIVLWVKAGALRMVVLIENKINAPEQPRQDKRYHIRGRRLVKEAGYDDYITVICAPNSYLGHLPAESAYQHRVSYEDIARWFDAMHDSRAAWRGDVFRQASDPANRQSPMQVNEATTAFHREYWGHLCQHHPQLIMNEPGEKGPESTWIYMKAETFPKYVGLRHKMDEHVILLDFRNRNVQELLNAEPDWPEDIQPAQRGKGAALFIRVPQVDPFEEFQSQKLAVEEALRAAYRLLPYARVLHNTAAVP